MPKRSDALPVGRLRRGAQVGRLLGGEAARSYATRAANLSRSADARKAADERRRQEAAEHVVAVLGQMKGAAMKVGQMASLIDLGRLPAEERDEFQAKLGELRDSAPRVRFKDMQKVIERELGDRIANLFVDFDPEAAASASIGQVYRARLRDGRDVAVKELTLNPPTDNSKGLRIGKQIDPGVPWTATIGDPPIALALKSGNFGRTDFFLRSFSVLP